MSDSFPISSKQKNSRSEAIGFSRGLLSEEPLRIEVLADTPDFIALNKPANISLRQHPWDENIPNLDSALNLQLKEGKPEILALGAKSFGSIFYFEKAISGLALFSKHKKALTFLRNAFGSGLMEFHFQFIAQAEETIEENMINETPLIPHRYKFKMVPSTAKGKRARTEFKCLKRGNDSWSLWQAKINYFRPHQLRIHASLSGLHLMNDDLYCGVDAPTYASVGKRKKIGDQDTKIFSDLALTLNSVQFASESADSVHIVAEPSKAFKTTLNYLGLK
ncbi:MAG: Uncharacterised protein [Puniceicoccaceae bacterium MED-G32]|nr:MAG: Uncharacterised protein [Puniceicoccaceae bacterium MED-G32]